MKQYLWIGRNVANQSPKISWLYQIALKFHNWPHEIFFSFNFHPQIKAETSILPKNWWKITLWWLPIFFFSREMNCDWVLWIMHSSYSSNLVCANYTLKCYTQVGLNDQTKYYMKNCGTEHQMAVRREYQKQNMVWNMRCQNHNAEMWWTWQSLCPGD